VKITDEMVEQAAIRAWRSERRASASWSDVGPASQAMFRSEARAVLEYALSIMSAATLGPTREDRLMAYRRAALQGLLASGAGGGDSTIRCAESTAHAMLAAERPADAPAPLPLCLAAIRRVRDVMREEPDITPEGVIEEFERAVRNIGKEAP
jgi:hypothetical protein